MSILSSANWLNRLLSEYSMDEKQVAVTGTPSGITGVEIGEATPETSRIDGQLIGCKRKAPDAKLSVTGAAEVDERRKSQTRLELGQEKVQEEDERPYEEEENGRLRKLVKEYGEECESRMLQIKDLELEKETLQGETQALIAALAERQEGLQEAKRLHERQVEALKAECLESMATAQRDSDHKYAVLQRGLEGTWSQASRLRTERDALEQEVSSLRAQIGQLETRWTAQAASGSYLDSAATPSDVQLAADRIKQALASFIKALMYGKGNQLKDKQKLLVNEILDISDTTLARDSDVKFCYQTYVSEILFSGFEAEDYNFKDCLHPELDWEKMRADNFAQHKQLSSMRGDDPELVKALASSMSRFRSEWEDEYPLPVHLVACPRSCPHVGGDCACGLVRFLIFCHWKVGELMESGLGGFWSQPSSGGEEDINLSKQLLPLLTSVWLSHLLVCSFKEPCSLVKLKSGMHFDPAYMEKVTVRDDELDAPEVPKVAFMVVPGFRIAGSVVRAQVYVHQG